MDDAFRQARAMGMTAARTWAHSINQMLPFQTGPGAYDPQGLAALDYVLDSASRHGIQLILSFIDNWKYYNGVAQVLDDWGVCCVWGWVGGWGVQGMHEGCQAAGVARWRRTGG